jgi:hypothetical protein
MGDKLSGEPIMSGIGWSLTNIASQLLEHNDREAVIGDLLEAGESSWRGLLHVVGLLMRQQILLWKSWRPWTAAFALVFPCSFLLMGSSVSISLAYEKLLTGSTFNGILLTSRAEFSTLFCQSFLLIAWSWTAGFVVGSLSRKTLWLSAALTCLPCLFCLSRFRVESLSRLCLLLFLLPAILGARQGLRMIRMKLGAAMALATVITIAMIWMWSRIDLWTFQWALIWPAWYIVATSEGFRTRQLKEENAA